MARHTTSPETAKPSSSSKRTSGARHAYLGSNGVVIVKAETAAELEAWQPPTQTTPRPMTTRATR